MVEKATRRRQGRLARGKSGDRRFFGEAVVAAHPSFAHRAGWYSSFKWLSSPAWCAARLSYSRGYRAQFRTALGKFGINLEQVQLKQDALRPLLNGHNAVPPDLWLFTGGEHRFIEVKLPHDCLSEPQIAGLALIATSLKATQPVSVEVVTLVDDAMNNGSVVLEDAQERFRSFSGALTAFNPLHRGSD